MIQCRAVLFEFDFDFDFELGDDFWLLARASRVLPFVRFDVRSDCDCLLVDCRMESKRLDER
jgi:hypothetical protein